MQLQTAWHYSDWDVTLAEQEFFRWSWPYVQQAFLRESWSWSTFFCFLRTNLLRSGPGKPNQRKAGSWTFSGGIPAEQKFNVNRACFLRISTRIHKNGRNSWTFRFGPFLVWFAGATPDLQRILPSSTKPMLIKCSEYFLGKGCIFFTEELAPGRSKTDNFTVVQ